MERKTADIELVLVAYNVGCQEKYKIISHPYNLDMKKHFPFKSTIFHIWKENFGLFSGN
jgi:hypothetical protein